MSSGHVPKRNHGGPRPGSGRPRQLENAVRVTVVLDESDLQKLKQWQAEHKNASLSAALRHIVQVMTY